MKHLIDFVASLCLLLLYIALAMVGVFTVGVLFQVLSAAFRTIQQLLAGG
jgi:thiol:disulfide interchange protein